MQQKQKGEEHHWKQSIESSVTKAILHLDQTAISLPVFKKKKSLQQTKGEEARLQTAMTRSES